MKKTLQFILALIIGLGIFIIPSHMAKGETKNIENINKIEARDGISNNSIKFLAYNHPWDLQTEWVEFKFVPQGNGTAKLKYYTNGKVLDASHVKRNLTMYYKTQLKHSNIYGYDGMMEFGRGQYMYNVAEFLENLTFTYGVDNFQIIQIAYLAPPIPIWDGQDEGIVGAKIEGPIHSNLANRDFNDDLRFSGTRGLYQFRVEKDGLYAQYKNQVKIPDGEYIIETAETPNRVLDVLSSLNAGVDNHNSNRGNQKFELKYDNRHKAYKIKTNYKNTVLNWQSSQGNNVDYTIDRDYAEQFWYLEDAGNGRHRLVNAKNTVQVLNLDANNTNISVNGRNSSSLKQQFTLVKSDKKLGLTDGEWKIASKINNNKVANLDIGGRDPNNVTIWDNANVRQQKWRFKYDTNKNAYSIINSYNNKGLMWNNNGTTRNVIALGQGYTDEQLWVLEYVGDGYYIFKNLRNQNMVLDLYNSDTRNAANIQVYERNNGDNQKFKLIR